MKHDLTDFLLARIAEDEAAARHQPECSCGPSAPYDSHEWACAMNPQNQTADPARMLIECEAKRRMIAQFSNVGWATYAVRDVLFELLALPYADHPDYREEWRP